MTTIYLKSGQTIEVQLGAWEMEREILPNGAVAKRFYWEAAEVAGRFLQHLEVGEIVAIVDSGDAPVGRVRRRGEE